ncbi:hypothetical protein FOMPIDRAFT_1054742 [Fomitopsis schrenkii]|uniref:Uncharacterized protein n=1 Tax=Fomitopsis schrenkii TaxID=2126942 RepID=S8EZ60_FOMSC|nr:hypothetical protein FOMPIDRAFT_1054742 [Fomitopsis schrenkii]
MKAEQPSPSTMSDKTHDETDVAEPMSSAQEPRQVDARPSGLFVASSSGQAAEDALPLAAGPVDVMVRPAMNVPQHPLPSTPNGNAPGAAAGTHPVASLREEPRQVDAEPAVSSTGSCSGLKDQDVMQALEDILDRVTAQGRGEMKIVSDAHAIVLNALNAFFKAGGSGGGDWAARSQ